MTSLLRLLAFVVLLAAALATSWFVFRSDDGLVPAAPVVAPREATVVTGAVGLEEVEATPHSQAAAVVEPWPWPSPSDDEADPPALEIDRELRGLMDAGATDRPVPRLRVESPAGEPVPKARVEIVQRRAEGEVRFERRFERRAGRDGLVSLSFLHDGPFDVVASDPRERFGYGSLQAVVASPEEIIVRLGELQEIEVEAYELGGGPLEWFTARIVGPIERDQQSDLEHFARLVTRRQSGRIRLAIDRPEFYVQVIGEHHALCELGPFDARSAPRSVVARLARNGGVRGRVLAEGLPAAEVRVTLHADTSSSDEGFPHRSARNASFETTSANDGTFELAVRSSGRFYLRATESHLASAEIGPLDLDPALTIEGLTLALDSGGTIAGKVLLPIDHKRGSIGVGASRGDGFVEVAAVDSNGSYRLRRLMPGRWTVEVRRFGSASDRPRFLKGLEDGVKPWTTVDVLTGGTSACDFDLRSLSAEAAELFWIRHPRDTNTPGPPR